MATWSRPFPAPLPPSPSSSMESDETLVPRNNVLHHSFTQGGGVQLRAVYRKSDNPSSMTLSTDYSSVYAAHGACCGLPGPGRSVGRSMAFAGRFLEKWVNQAQVVLKEKRQMAIQVTKEVKVVNHCGKGCLNCHLSSDRAFKILLLGAGESGKSALFKQLQRHWGPSFSSDTTMGAVIVYRCLEHLRQLLETSLESPDSIIQAHLSDVENLLLGPIDSFREDVPRPDTMQAIWKHPLVQKVIACPEEFQHISSLSYFIQHWDRISRSFYVPTEEDILAYSYRTVGINSFSGLEGTLEVIDTGGQLCERRKWRYLSNDVDVVLFVVSLTQFAETMEEDAMRNRMHDSLNLFESVCENQAYSETTVILVFTKRDLFAQALSWDSFQQAFPEYMTYQGPVAPEAALKHIEQRFTNVAISHGKLVRIVHTNSFDRDSSNVAIENIEGTLLRHPYQSEAGFKRYQ